MNKEQPPTLFEIAGNFHVHTNHSDGAGSHQQVAMAAARAGLDVIIGVQDLPFQQASRRLCCLFSQLADHRPFL